MLSWNSCFFDDTMDIGNLISGSSAFSKSNLNIWKFLVYVLLKPWRILSITLLACEMSAIVWSFEHSLALPFLGIGVKTDLFQSCGHCCVFQISWHIELAAAAAKLLQSHLTLCDPMDCSPPGSSVHGIPQARILEGVAMLSSRGSSPPRGQPTSPALQADSSPALMISTPL